MIHTYRRRNTGTHQIDGTWGSIHGTIFIQLPRVSIVQISCQNDWIGSHIFEHLKNQALLVSKATKVVTIPRRGRERFGSQGAEKSGRLGRVQGLSIVLNLLRHSGIGDKLVDLRVVSLDGTAHGGRSGPNLPRLTSILGRSKVVSKNTNIRSNHGKRIAFKDACYVGCNAFKIGCNNTTLVGVLLDISVCRGEREKRAPSGTVDGRICKKQNKMLMSDGWRSERFVKETFIVPTF